MVHRAVTTDGRAVAVKVLRPGIEGVVAADLDFMRPLFRFFAAQGSEVGGILLQFAAGLEDSPADPFVSFIQNLFELPLHVLPAGDTITWFFPDDLLNRILWRATMGTQKPYPAWAVNLNAED